MPRTIAICGYGPGISEGVARKFGREGFQVALVARDAAKVRDGARALEASGVKAQGFACDLGDMAAVERLVGEIRESLGPITVLHWNAAGGRAADLTACEIGELRSMFDVGVNGLVLAMQKTRADMKSASEAAILVTGGGLALYSSQVDAMTVPWHAMGLAVVKAAQHKLVGVLHHRLKGEGIYVGEVVVVGSVRGTAFDRGQPGTLEPSAIAEQFWRIYRGRSEVWIQYAG